MASGSLSTRLSDLSRSVDRYWKAAHKKHHGHNGDCRNNDGNVPREYLNPQPGCIHSADSKGIIITEDPIPALRFRARTDCIAMAPCCRLWMSTVSLWITYCFKNKYGFERLPVTF